MNLLRLTICVTFLSFSWQERIPLSVLLQISAIGDADEFTRKFVISNKNPREPDVGNRTLAKDPREPDVGNRTLAKGRPVPGDKNQGNIAKNEPCKVRPTVVDIPKPADPSVTYWPRCTMINRCGGCTESHQECAPTVVTNDVINVKVYHYVKKGTFVQRGTKELAISRHDGCVLQCRVKKEDCTVQQVYKPTTCTCQCVTRPIKCASNKKWNRKTCLCVCKVVKTCTGHQDSEFDKTTCKCQRKISKSSTARTIISGTHNSKNDGNKLDCSSKVCPAYWIAYANKSRQCACKII